MKSQFFSFKYPSLPHNHIYRTLSLPIPSHLISLSLPPSHIFPTSHPLSKFHHKYPPIWFPIEQKRIHTSFSHSQRDPFRASNKKRPLSLTTSLFHPYSSSDLTRLCLLCLSNQITTTYRPTFDCSISTS